MSSIINNNQLISDITQYDTTNILFETPQANSDHPEISSINIRTQNPDNTIGKLLFTVPEDTIIGFRSKKNHHSVSICITDEIYTKLHSIIDFCKSHMDKIDPTFEHTFESMASCVQPWIKKVIQVKSFDKSRIYLEKDGIMNKVKAEDLPVNSVDLQFYLMKPVIQLRAITRIGGLTYLNWILYEADVKYHKPVPRKSLLHPQK